MGEAIQPSTANRDWRVHCHDTDGEPRVCIIDSDHGAVRLGLNIDGQEQFFELRAEQVIKFQVALEAILGMIEAGGSNEAARWQGHCYNSWGELGDCLIEVSKPDTVRVSCVTAQTSERECSLELQQEHIGQFRAALAASMGIFHADVAIHGKHWADDETEGLPPRGMKEADFVEEINKMVATHAPQTLALVAEIGNRVDAMTMAWCVKFPDRTEVISDGPDGVRGSFHSVERAIRVLSAHGKVKVRVVSVTDAQKRIKAT